MRTWEEPEHGMLILFLFKKNLAKVKFNFSKLNWVVRLVCQFILLSLFRRDPFGVMADNKANLNT